jgi:hypothetical protein
MSFNDGKKFFPLLLPLLLLIRPAGGVAYRSVVGDPMFARDNGTRVMIEGWNFCNRCGRDCAVAPRWADCPPASGAAPGPGPEGNRVTDADNAAGLADDIDPLTCDAITQQKERNLGALCIEPGAPSSTPPSFFWTGMLKSGNFDTWEEGHLCGLWCKNMTPSCDPPSSLTFDNLPMNQPRMFHAWSKPVSGNWVGAFYGTWDINATQAELAAMLSPEVKVAAVAAAAEVCSPLGAWLGGQGDTGAPIIVARNASTGQYTASCQFGGPSAWMDRPLTVDADGLITLSLPGHSNQGRFVPSSVNFSDPCGGIQWGSDQSSWWCPRSTPHCTITPAPPPPSPSNPPSYFALEWFNRDIPGHPNAKILRSTLRTSQEYPWLMLYTGADAATGL